MGVSSSEPSQHSSPCTDLLFLLALLPLPPLWLILRWPMLTALLMAVLTLALLPLTHMLPMELPQLPMLLLPQLLLLPLLSPTLLPLPLLVLDSPKPLPMLFPLSDRLLRLLLSSRLLSPLSSGDTRLLTKQSIHH